MRCPFEKKKKASEADLACVLQALGDPVRLSIVRQLARQGEIPCGGFGIDMPKSTLSHHFRVLRDAGILGSRSEGTTIRNFLRRDEMEHRFPGILSGVLRNL
jgi:DNA-binding transcriptional ArsR family regulator